MKWPQLLDLWRVAQTTLTVREMQIKTMGKFFVMRLKIKENTHSYDGNKNWYTSKRETEQNLFNSIFEYTP